MLENRTEAALVFYMVAGGGGGVKPYEIAVMCDLCLICSAAPIFGNLSLLANAM
jgi:hypothetical protein